ncbi:PREDICTED: uncharacterized protein LOC104813832 [Tarenaya hassleriana]|uniref:uncharacterized protein LOC104813832 n=1 Tax=Tarenaya hassleriana TaxID=28532 RepID=UPI00053C5207|nr:PREDICTED: uncharacterized protein LOC104813832 [Tarenaya hassleriana]
MMKNFMGSILFLMLIGSVLVEARPLGLSQTEEKLMVGFFDGLSLGSIKQSGPSPGEGHRFADQRNTLGSIKPSGPSPSGPGH